IRLLEDAYHVADPADLAVRAQLASRLAVRIRFVDSRRAAKLAEEAVELGRQSSSDVLASALVSRRYVVWAHGHEDELMDLGDELLALATSAKRPDLAFYGHATRRSAFQNLGALDRASEEVAAFGALATRA